jgi:prevent-host-death family protein
MQTVGIKTLKDRLSEYIRTVAAGETVLVTDRGRVVAEIIPPRVPTDASPAEQKMVELARRGLLRPAVRRLKRPPPHQPIISFDDLMAELEADRADR